MNIVLDTQVLIYAVEDARFPESEELHSKARRYVEKMYEDGHKLILPAVVVGEYLVAHQHDSNLDALNELVNSQFVIAPFDAKTALIYGNVFRQKGLEMVREKCQSQECRRRKVAIDCQVVATTVARKADILVSNDGDLKRLGDGLVEVVEVPSIHVQQKLVMS